LTTSRTRYGIRITSSIDTVILVHDFGPINEYFVPYFIKLIFIYINTIHHFGPSPVLRGSATPKSANQRGN
jgi:hypothetical protein